MGDLSQYPSRGVSVILRFTRSRLDTLDPTIQPAKSDSHNMHRLENFASHTHHEANSDGHCNDSYDSYAKQRPASTIGILRFCKQAHG